MLGKSGLCGVVNLLLKINKKISNLFSCNPYFELLLYGESTKYSIFNIYSSIIKVV